MLASACADILMTIFSRVLKDGVKCYTNACNVLAILLEDQIRRNKNKKGRSSFN